MSTDVDLAELTDLLEDALTQPGPNITYHLSHRLRTLFPDRALLEVEDPRFQIEPYAHAGLCALRVEERPHPQRRGHWAGPKHGIYQPAEKVWFAVEWQGNALDVLSLTFGSDHGPTLRAYVLAESEAVAKQFAAAVCQWNAELRDEVLVFENGLWHKDPVLFRSIRGSTLDNLVLRGTLKDDIRVDLESFFANQGTYERYAVPWKRGILLVGPPGNGKTHAVKALVNSLRRNCLYVKSFRSQMPDEMSIQMVFNQARQSSPCILVLEDLDSLVTPTNRSFFLNELDGFAGNDGILTLATTNHPERLDPAILDRPSRFDRKYPFDLPAEPERAAYIDLWNRTLEPELRLSDGGMQAVAAATDGFSFAYLKELFVSSTMSWINRPEPGTMDAVMTSQVVVLREQMASAIVHDAPQVDPRMGGMMPPHMMHSFVGMHQVEFGNWSDNGEEFDE